MSPRRSVWTLAVSIFGAVAAWEALGRSGIYSVHLFPPPSRVLPALLEMARSGELWLDFRSSALRWLPGFALGCLGGLLMGLLSGRIVLLRQSAGQLLHMMRCTPLIVLIPIAILWFGIGELEKIVMVAWGVFFPVWINTQAGVEELEEEYSWAAASLGMRGGRMYAEVLLPRALPGFLTGMRIGIATGVFALGAAEMAGAFEGLAFRVFYSHQMFQTDKMMAGIVFIGMLGYSLDCTFRVCARRFMPWANGKAGHG